MALAWEPQKWLELRAALASLARLAAELDRFQHVRMETVQKRRTVRPNDPFRSVTFGYRKPME